MAGCPMPHVPCTNYYLQLQLQLQSAETVHSSNSAVSRAESSAGAGWQCLQLAVPQALF